MYDLTFRLEDRLWWYLGMRRVMAALLPAPTGRWDVLDAGCGTGGTTAWLARYGRVVGIDRAPEALALARSRQLARLVRGSVDRLPFADASFDLLASFDVIYHRAVDDRAALAEFHRVLRPGGLALIRLPAYDRLRGAHDRAVHTRHRYTAAELAGLLGAAGFRVERISYANTLLFPAALARRLGESRAADSSARAPRESGATTGDFWEPPAALNRLLELPLALEAALIRRGLALPFGLSVVALARKGAG